MIRILEPISVPDNSRHSLFYLICKISLNGKSLSASMGVRIISRVIEYIFMIQLFSVISGFNSDSRPISVSNHSRHSFIIFTLNTLATRD